MVTTEEFQFGSLRQDGSQITAKLAAPVLWDHTTMTMKMGTLNNTE